jgi:hypothetical protein
LPLLRYLAAKLRMGLGALQRNEMAPKTTNELNAACSMPCDKNRRDVKKDG